MRSLLEVINMVCEGKVSKKASPLMKDIYEYFNTIYKQTDKGTQSKTNELYDIVVKDCTKVDLSNSYKELKEKSYIIFQKSKKNSNEFVTVIFTRPNISGDNWGSIECEIDSICFSGFTENGFYGNISFVNISSLKKLLGKYRGCPIEIYEINKEDAYSTHPKKMLGYDMGADLYNK